MKINGSLVFDASSASEIQNLRVQKYANFAAIPLHTAADAGRMVYAISETTLYFGTATAWVAIATGGNAAALQTEVDALETSLGSIVNSSGVFVVNRVTGPAFTGTEASLTELLQALSNYADNNNTLAELDDVTLTAAAAGDFLRYNGTVWADHVLVAANLTDVTSTAAELNILDGATLDVTELNYVDGVTSPIQTQLNNKQGLDAGLTALAVYNTNGILVQTADNVWAGRTLVAPADGITITDPAGIAGNPTFALANDLGALEALATTGYAVRTALDTWTTRTIGGTAGRVVVSNGDGVASNTDIDLATLTDGATGTFLKFARDAYGRVSGTTAVVTADITALVDATYVNVAGDSMSSAANLTFSGGGTVMGLPSPTNDTDAANKAYVDALTTGLTWKAAVDAATTTNGVLATAFAAGQVVDGVTLTAGMRVLLKDQTAPAENGIYVVQASGAPVRASDMNAPAEFDGAAVFVKAGTVNESAGFTETATVATVGTDPVVFSQFSGSATYTWGIGLAATGNTINVNLGAGIAQLPSDEVGIDLFDVSTGAIILTDNGTLRAGSPATNSKLHLLLDSTATGGLNQGTLGLFIKAAGVTNAMLVNPTFTVNADSGTPDPVALGETLLFAGTSGQGINTSVTGNTITITAADASTGSKGVASFAPGDFDVTVGVVTVKAGGIDNAQLAFSTVTLTGTSGSDAFALGESVAVVGGAGGEVSTAVTANQVAISVRDATASLKGVASFAAADFLVTAGNVTAVAKNISSLTDVETTTPVAGQVLSYDGTNWVNKKAYHLETVAVAATSWTVSHALGVRYCNVTVVDSTEEVVIPQSITFNSTTQLIVTFNTAIAGKVVVMGIA